MSSFQAVADKHQTAIAWKTLKMNKVFANMMGIGHSNAIKVLLSNGVTVKHLERKLAEFGHNPDEIAAMMQ